MKRVQRQKQALGAYKLGSPTQGILIEIKKCVHHYLPLLSIGSCSFWVGRETDLTMTTVLPGTDSDLETTARVAAVCTIMMI